MDHIHDVLIIGAGFSGLGMGVELDKHGLSDWLIIERDDEVGGTWWANQYPGCACDVESQLYSFSFELNPQWSHTFARQPEILAYLKGVADKYDLRRRIRFQTAATAATFEDRHGVWTVTTNRGDTIRARSLACCAGGLSHPTNPKIDGLETFAGTMFHSARWNHSAKLEKKRVGVIGTGASAIQIVPEIVDKVRTLNVFQRTPPWIVPRLDREIGAGEKALYAAVPALQWLVRAGYYWRRELVVGPALIKQGLLTRLLERMARAHLARSVRDPELRRKLLPSYVIGCKRILISNDYYPALQRPNAALTTESIERIEPRGVITKDGKLHELDVLVLASGFEASERAVRFDMRGRDGRTLDDAWKNGMEAYYGTTISGFPNFYLVPGPNIGGGHTSLIFMLEAQIRYAVSAIREMRARGARFVDVRPAIQANYNAKIQRRFEGTVWSSGCHAWYRTANGKHTVLYPDLTARFFLETRRFDAENYDFVADQTRERGTTPAESVTAARSP